jgi:hypothetical protein
VRESQNEDSTTAKKPPAASKRSKRQLSRASTMEEEDDSDLSGMNSSAPCSSRQTSAVSMTSSSSSSDKLSKPPELRPVFQSLIQIPSDADAPCWEDKVRPDTSIPEPPAHFAGNPVPFKQYSVCGVCGMDEDNGGTIVLCDGPGCNQEFHMVCCRPPMMTVPEGDFYCFDCSPEGATESLRRYLDGVEARREAYFETSPGGLSFVDQLIFGDMKEHQPSLFGELNGETLVNDSITDTQMAEVLLKVRPPVSELDKFHANNARLVGKVIRLFCTETNDYHTGRILKVRPLTKPRPDGVSSVDNELHWDSECLVRFQAGMSNRKSTLTRWVRLEEHSLAICTDLVWALNAPPIDVSQESSKSAKSERLPTKLWMRTSRELVMSLHMLQTETGQVHYRNWRLQNEKRTADADFGKIEHPWILGELIGRAKYKLLHVFATRKSSHFSNATLGGNSYDTNVSKSIKNAPLEDLPDGPMFKIMSALEQIEQEEQARILEWTEEIPLQNLLHPKALSCEDECALDALGHNASLELIQPSPLVRKGLDRMFILDHAAKLWEDEHKAKTGEAIRFRTKDVALSLSCTLVDSGCITSCIHDFNEKERHDCGDQYFRVI